MSKIAIPKKAKLSKFKLQREYLTSMIDIIKSRGNIPMLSTPFMSVRLRSDSKQELYKTPQEAEEDIYKNFVNNNTFNGMITPTEIVPVFEQNGSIKGYYIAIRIENGTLAKVYSDKKSKPVGSPIATNVKPDDSKSTEEDNEDDALN